jgi:hypothetical protein
MVGRRWWDRRLVKSHAEIASLVWARVDRSGARTTKLDLRDRIYEAVYHGRPLSDRGREEVAAIVTTGPNGDSRRLNINVTQSKVDAITSRMSKHRVFPVIGVQGAPYTEGLHAREATQALRAKLKTADVIRAKPATIRGCLIRGTSAMGVRAEGGDVLVEDVPRRELVVGDKDAAEGKPRNIVRVQSMALEVACARWPDHRADLERDATPRDESTAWERAVSISDAEDLRVTVATAHHLPSGNGTRDGRLTVCTRDCVLEDREWKHPRFPYAFWHWIPPTTGFWGQALVEVLLGIQADINDTARDIRENLRWGSGLIVFNPRGSNVPNAHLSGRQPRVVEYDGQQPHHVAPMPVSPQQFQFFERLISLADDLSGLAKDYSTGTTQLGANVSGRAVQMLDDIQSDRFAMFQQVDTAAMLDLGWALFDCARDLEEASRTGQLAKDVQLAEWIDDFDWRRVDPEKGYRLEFEPENFIPSTRSGRLAAINEVGATGLVSDPDAMLDAFDEPDMQRILHEQLGARRATRRVISGLYSTKTPVSELMPPATFPLEKGIKAVENELNTAFAAEAEDEVLDRFDQWLQLAHDKLTGANKAKPAPAAPGMPPDPAGAPPPEGLALGAPGEVLQDVPPEMLEQPIAP